MATGFDVRAVISWMNAPGKEGPRKHFLAAVCIAALCVVVYANTLGNGFVMDDWIVVKDNGFIASWTNVRYFFDPVRYFTASGERTYRPMTTLSYFMDHSLWRYNPSGYHLTNLVIHAANGILFYFMLVLLVSLSRGAEKKDPSLMTPWLYAPFISAVLFVSHPAGTEAVNFIGGRHVILMSFFYLAAICAYQKVFSVGGKINAWYYALSLAMYAFSCFSIEAGITLPAVLVLIDLYSRPVKAGMDFWKRRIGLYSGFAVMALGFVYIRACGMVCSGENLGADIYRFARVGGILLTYLRIFIFPVSLSAEYGAGPGYGKKLIDSFSVPEAYIPAAVLFALAGAIFLYRRKFPMLFFGAAWSFITLFPMSNIPYELVSFPAREKYVYLPLAGFCMALGFGLCRLGSGRWGALDKAVSRRITIAAAGFLVVFYSCRSIMRNTDWKDGVALWSATARYSPESYRAYYNLGMAYQYERGETAKSVEAFKESIKRNDLAMTHDALGFVYLQDRQYQQALGELALAKKKDPQLGSVYYHLGLLYLATGEYDKVIAVQKEGFDNAKESFFHYSQVPLADMHAVSGKAYLAKGDYPNAIMEFEASLDLRPGDPEVSFCMGKACMQEGLFDKAINALKAALRADPCNVQTCYALANVYLKTKALDKAEKEYVEILKIDPRHADARNNLANIYYSRGLVSQAVEEYKKALEADPAHFRARNNLANIYLMSGNFDKAISEYLKVIEREPGNAVVHYNLGLAYDGKGLTIKAEEEWKEAVRIDPGFGQAAEALRQSEAKRNAVK